MGVDGDGSMLATWRHRQFLLMADHRHSTKFGNGFAAAKSDFGVAAVPSQQAGLFATLNVVPLHGKID
jgi:hypothetical protein